MDFSSLDLLASTALRDNNQAQAASSAATPSHLQLNHDDNVDSDEDDDDEPDGENGFSADTGAVGVNESSEMGSVKIGKNKKGTSGANKPVLKSIFVKDGKYVSKKVSNNNPDGTGHPVVLTEAVRTKEELELCYNNNSVPDTFQATLPAEGAVSASVSPAGGHLCNGGHGEEHKSTVHSAALNCDSTHRAAQIGETVQDSGSKVRETETSVKDALSDKTATESQHDSFVQGRTDLLPQSQVATEAEVSGVSSAACDSERLQDACCSVETADTGDSKLPQVTEESCDSQTSTPCSRTEEQQTCDRPLHPTSVSAEQSLQAEVSGTVVSEDSTGGTPVLSCLSSVDGGAVELHAPSSDPSSADTSLPISSPADTLTLHEERVTPDFTSTDRETVAAETGGCHNCDENRAVQAASPHPPLPSSSALLSPSSSSSTFPHPSSLTTVTGREKDPSRDYVDQDFGSSGNNDINTSTNSLHAMLSPPHPPLASETDSADIVLMDHCYFSSSDKLAHGQSAENTDDSGDAFESADENVSADDIERRPRSLSVDSEYLQYGVPLATSQADKTSLLSPTLSVDSISNDSSMSEHSSAAGGHFYSILTGVQPPARSAPQQKLPAAESVDSVTGSAEPSRLTASMLDSTAGGPKCGKFRIGTFGSFSNSHLDLEGDGKKLKIGIPTPEALMKFSNSSPALVSPGSPFPLLQSPGMEWDRSDAGSEAPDDLDSSATEDRFLSSSHDSECYASTSSQVWNHPVFHDHDYFCKEVSEKLGKPVAPLKGGKRKNTRKKDRFENEDEKLKKGKYLKMELLKQDNRFNLTGGGSGGSNGVDRSLTSKSSLLAESLTSKPNPVGRPRKRLEKQVEEYDSETGTKMKITGKYQDQYVYYYSKTSRNRRRKLDEKVPPGDKIILPPSKPGDIVVPHLTDADCEAIKRGGRAALKSGGTSFNSSHLGGGGLPHADNGDIMDSSIVNTILSMESDNLATSSLGSHDGDGDFSGIEENLTTEQVDLLLDCLKDVEVATTSQALDSILTSAESVPMVPNYLDSLAGTTVEGDFLVPGLPMSTAASLPAVSGTVDAPLRSEPAVPDQPSSSAFMKQGVMTSPVKPVVSSSSSLSGMQSSHPSVEKNLEFLKNPNIKPDFYPVPVSVPSANASNSFVPVTQSSPSSSEAETPWIVTVTLYWNDIPAIIINNTPYVRLVDIHRQILPAKDTGILKKRCQLMHIQVSNCTEMQRYFLVQYGRAHNSKSTLVITKDEAFRLISYYANPQPRNLRGEEGALLRRSSSYAELQSYMASPSSRGQSSSPAPGFAHPRKRGGFRRRNTPTRSRNPSPEAVVAAVTPQGGEQPPPSPLPAEPASPSKRLRHKKINFLEMLKGEDSAHHAASPVVEGSVGEDDTSSREEGLSLKAAKSNKRRGSKELGEGSPSKRGRTSRQHSEEMKKILLGITAGEQQAEPEISVDSDSLECTADGTKNKKRSPGSSGAVPLSTTNRSPKSNFGPIKVNVKSLVSAGQPTAAQPRKKNLFGRKSGSTDTAVMDSTVEADPASRPLRVLRISHQDAEAASPPPDASPVAEVHLDLYKRASSPCVHCSTCDQYLSVAGFLKHHHTSNSLQGLVSAKRRIVPMNKENISSEEQRLWNEFVGLQERLEHSVSAVGMGAYPLSPQGASECPETLDAAQEQGGSASALPHPHGVLGDIPPMDSTAMVASGGSCSTLDSSGVSDDATTPAADRSIDSPWEPQISVCSPPPLSLPATHTEIEEKLVNSVAVDIDRKPHPTPKRAAPARKQQAQQPKRDAALLNVRTSSRKRKRKQFYGFENYDFAAGGKKSGRGDGDAQDSVVDVTGTIPEDEANVNGIDASNGPLASHVHE